MKATADPAAPERSEGEGFEATRIPARSRPLAVWAVPRVGTDAAGPVGAEVTPRPRRRIAT